MKVIGCNECCGVDINTFVLNDDMCVFMMNIYICMDAAVMLSLVSHDMCCGAELDGMFVMFVQCPR